GRSADVWWSGVRGKLERAGNLQVHVLDAEATRDLAALAERTMSLSVNITDRTAWVSCDRGDVSLDVRSLREAAGPAAGQPAAPPVRVSAANAGLSLQQHLHRDDHRHGHHQDADQLVAARDGQACADGAADPLARQH